MNNLQQRSAIILIFKEKISRYRNFRNYTSMMSFVSQGTPQCDRIPVGSLVVTLLLSMMRSFKYLFAQVFGKESDKNFLQFIHVIENLVSKVLAIAMIAVILFAVVDLGRFLIHDLQTSPEISLPKNLIQIFGLFLNILVALEILDNVAAYLRHHAIQLELVVITALTAVARKIIIYDSKEAGSDYIGLAFAILALSISYWIVRHVNRSAPEK